MKSNKKVVLTPSHPLWPKFRKDLDNVVTVYDDGKLLNKCKGDLTLAIEILESLKNIDVKETILFFKEYGGSCSCKVLANVARIYNNR